MEARRAVRNLLLIGVLALGVLEAGDPNPGLNSEIGVSATIAGQPGVAGHVDGTGSEAQFNNPKAMSVDIFGNIYTVDNACGTLRKITPEGKVTTLAGPETGCAYGSTDGPGNIARFNQPSGTTVDFMGNVFVADSGNCTLRKVTPAGVVSTVAGATYVCVAVDGPKSVARFNGLAGVAVDQFDNVFVTSWTDCTVRKVTPAGYITTVAGVSGLCASVDGRGSEARFGNPSGISMDGFGNFYVADETGCTIRKISPDYEVTTMAGNPGVCGYANGVGKQALFNVPSWTAVDQQGNVYAPEYMNFTIRQVTPNGVATTLVGLAGTEGSTDGTGTAALFNHPDGIAVDIAGNIYVADRDNNTVRRVTITRNPIF